MWQSRTGGKKVPDENSTQQDQRKKRQDLNQPRAKQDAGVRQNKTKQGTNVVKIKWEVKLTEMDTKATQDEEAKTKKKIPHNTKPNPRPE